jgi:GNAT superfamily N-acetyltransferase
MAEKGTYAVAPFPPTWAARPWGSIMRRIRPWLYLAHVTTRPLYEIPRLLPPEGIEVRYPTREELHDAADRGDMMLDKQRVDDSLARGDLCSVAFDGKKLIGYAWNAFRTAPHVDDIWIEFQAPYRYGYKSFVLPEYRGRRISNGTAPHSDADSIRQGFTHAISFVETHNYKSIRANCRHPGRRFEGIAGYFRLFGKVFPFRSPPVKRLGFRFIPPGERPLPSDGNQVLLQAAAGERPGE